MEQADVHSGKSISLDRIIGVRSLTLVIINATVGAGIFGMPTLAAQYLGAAAILAYLGCALLMGLIALCLAEACTSVPKTGGLYAYANASFGPFAGGLVGMLLFTASGAISNAAVAALLVETIGLQVPAFSLPLARVVLTVLIYAGCGLIHLRGTRGGITTAELTTVIKIAPLVVLMVVGSFFIHPSNLQFAAVPSFLAVARTSGLLIFMFTGIEAALSVSGEIRAPSHTVPRAILFGLGTVAALYIGVHLVAQGVLGNVLENTKAPLAQTASLALGRIGGILILFATYFASLGYIVGDVLTTPRVLLALGQDGFLPTVLGRIHPIRRTPATAIVCYAGLCAVLTLSGTFSALAQLASSGMLIIYLISCFGVFRARSRRDQQEGASFIVPFGRIIPLLACLGILALLLSFTAKDLFAVGLVVLVCAIPYFLRRFTV